MSSPRNCPSEKRQSRITHLVVSSCLTGERCRYDGRGIDVPRLIPLMKDRTVIKVCPEVEAGLGVPREPIHIRGNSGHQVLSGQGEVLRVRTGGDVTVPLLEACTRIALTLNRLDPSSTLVVLKERSPSCGVHSTHTDKGITAAPGLFAAFCIEKGFQPISEEDLEESS